MSCCGCLPLAEDNARFVLLAVVLICYMVVGAFIFQHLESAAEQKQEGEFWKLYDDFCEQYFLGTVNANNATGSEKLEQLHQLLYAYGNATVTGIVNKRRRWDFAGSFHFVGTIVSTIGYGNTTPQTTAGKAVVIAYGFLGCSGGILFFNLFLERIITLLAWMLRTLHMRRVKKRMQEATLSSRRVSRVSRASLPDILDDDESILEHWKPSVYWVMFALGLASCVVAISAASVYTVFEKWTYIEALYFCFVSFATIGFGDYVSTQEDNYPNAYLYKISNFLFLVLGCCCIYSLLNVTSIVIKQALNWMIEKMQCRCRDDPMSATGRFWRRHSMAFQNSRRNRRRRSSAAYPQGARKFRRVSIINAWRKSSQPNGATKKEDVDSDSAGYDTDGERRLSGELISIKDFLKANKVSLAVMQKQLYDTAQMQRGGYSGGTVYHMSTHAGPTRRPTGSDFTPGAVGPLAIVSKKLGDSVPAR